MPVMSEEQERALREAEKEAVREGEKVAIIYTLGAIIRHHPNREDVLDHLRMAHVQMAQMTRNGRESLGATADLAMSGFLEAVRECTRTILQESETP